MKSLFFFLLLFSYSLATAQEINYNGPFTLYQPDGKMVFLTGEYQDTVPQGTWTIYDYQGRIREIHRYKNGLLQDTFYQYAQGKLLSKGVFNDNLRNGPWETYSPNDGKWVQTEFYVNDTLEGWQKSRSHELLFEKGKANGPYLFYNYQGELQTWGQYVDNSREGVWVNKDGRIEVITYKNNLKNGPFYIFDGDSALAEMGNYQNNQKQGLQLNYRIRGSGKDKQSVLWYATNYEKGKKQGVSVEYFPDGDTLAIRYYHNNYLLGWETGYNQAGRVVEKRYHRDYKNRSESDSLFRWNDSGTLVEYKAGSSDNRLNKKWDDKGNRIFLDSSYTINGEPRRDLYAYSGGKVREERHWRNGYMHGRWYLENSYEYYFELGERVRTVKANEDFDFLVGDEDMIIEGAGDDKDYGIADRLQYNRMDNGSITLSGQLPVVYAHCIGSRSKTLLESGVHGTVVVQVYVFRDGTPASPRIATSLNPVADVEALRLALDSYWKVGRSKGILQPGWRYFSVEF